MNKRSPLPVPLPPPVEYAGQWVAWTRDRTRIVAHGRNAGEVRTAALAAGFSDALFQKVPHPDRASIGAL